MTNTVLILGKSGKIGKYAARAFQEAGWNVRAYDRSKNDMTGAAAGADVIVNGLNPPAYHDWARQIPAITKQVIAAAKASGAMVIVPGNVYNFGETPGVWSENTEQNAQTRKGKIRIDMEKSYRESGVKTVILRAGNFIAPYGTDDVMALVHLNAIKKGRVTALGDPNAEQAYCYLPDWARAAVQLAQMRDKLETFEDIPFPGHSFSTAQLKAELEHLLDRPLKLARFPWIVMTLAAPFWELAREMKEMRGLWNTSHRLDDRKFQRLLPGFRMTPLAQVLANTLPPEIQPDQRMVEAQLARSGGRP